VEIFPIASASVTAALAVAWILGACSDGKPPALEATRQYTASIVAASALSSAAAPSARLTATLSLEPATVSVVALSDLEWPVLLSAVADSDARLDNGRPEILIYDERLVVAAPGDTGADQDFTVVLRGNRNAVLNIKVKSVRPTAIAEGDEEGDTAPEPPALTISGLGPGNALGASQLVLGVANAKEFSASASRFLIETDSSAVNASKIFAHDQTTNTFSASATDLRAILNDLPNGELTFTANLVSKDFEFARVYSFQFLKGDAMLSGQLVDAKNQPLSGVNIDQLNVALVGVKNRTRRVAPVNANGQFGFEGLAPDNYNLVVTDLRQPNFFGGFVTLAPGSTAANVSLVYAANTEKGVTP
jgi:hypothetical protein